MQSQAFKSIWNVEMRETVLERAVFILNQISWCISRSTEDICEMGPRRKIWDPVGHDLFFYCFAPCGVRANLKQTVCQGHQAHACHVWKQDTELAGADKLPTNNSSYAREVLDCQIPRLKFILYHETRFKINPAVLHWVSTCTKCRGSVGSYQVQDGI